MNSQDTIGNHQEFDTGYGTRARITETHLVISGSPANPASQKVYAEYPLAEIASIRGGPVYPEARARSR